MFFWRQESAPEQVQMVPIDPFGNSSIYLANHPKWRGRLTEIGLVFYTNGDDVYSVQQLELQTWSAADLFEIIEDDWMTYDPISQEYINHIERSRAHQFFSFSAAVSLVFMIFLISFLLLALTKRISARHLLLSVTATAAALWLISDTVWLKARSQQAALLLEQDNSTIDEDFLFERIADSVKRSLPADEQEILVIAQTRGMWFEASKLNYHLLPLESLVGNSGIGGIAASWTDAILVIKDRHDPDPNISHSVSERLGADVDILLENQQILLLRVTTP